MHDFTIPIGPQHPSIKEPTCLRLSLEGNYIREAEIRFGYAHRGIEKLLEDKRIEKALQIAQRICGICSFAHSGCFVQAIERMLEYDAPTRVKYIRTLIAELERIHSHCLWMGVMMHEIGFETMFQYFLREREHVLEIFERITGGRVHHGINRVKTVRYDITNHDIGFILKKMDVLKKNISTYLRIVEKNRSIKSRLVDVGVISRNQAKRYCLVGPVARASGISKDIRRDDQYEAYSMIDFDVIVADTGDAYTRTIVRMKEILESISIITKLLKNMPGGNIPPCSPVFIGMGRAIGRVEAPRGENFHLLLVKHNKIERARIRPPTFANISILPSLLENREVGDTPVILNSLDPCFSCMERVIILKDGKTEVLTEHEFRRKYT